MTIDIESMIILCSTSLLNLLHISHHAPWLEPNIQVLLVLVCAVNIWIKVPEYWPPIHMHYGICAKDLFIVWLLFVCVKNELVDLILIELTFFFCECCSKGSFIPALCCVAALHSLHSYCSLMHCVFAIKLNSF